MAIDFESELRGDGDDDVRVDYGGVGQSIVSGIVIGILLLIATRCSDGNVKADTTVVDVRIELGKVSTELAGVKNQLQQLVNQPYERREDHERDIERLDARINNVERAIESGRKR